MFSTVGVFMINVGDILSTVEGVQYIELEVQKTDLFGFNHSNYVQGVPRKVSIKNF